MAHIFKEMPVSNIWSLAVFLLQKNMFYLLHYNLGNGFTNDDENDGIFQIEIEYFGKRTSVSYLVN